MKKKLFACVLAVVLACLSICSPIYAGSSSRTISNDSLSATLTANGWVQTLFDLDNSGEFQVSAVYKSTNSEFANPEWIKVSWDFRAYGIKASVKYKCVTVSAEGMGSDAGSGGYWINSNGARTAWYRGRVNAYGLCFGIGMTTTATCFKAGVIMSTSVR